MVGAETLTWYVKKILHPRWHSPEGPPQAQSIKLNPTRSGQRPDWERSPGAKVS